MKLVAIVENVNQKKNKNLVGQIVILDPELTMSGDFELCYEEDDCRYRTDRTWLQNLLPPRHSVANIEIIGVL